MGMTSSQRQKCAEIIKKASVAGSAIAAGLNLTNIPFSATAPLMAIEFVMVQDLGKVFGVDVSEANVKGVMGAVGAAVLGNGIYAVGMAEVGIGLAATIPFIGSVIGGVTAPFVITNLGWKVANYFAKNV